LGPEEAKSYLDNLKRGQHQSLVIRVPGQKGRVYTLKAEWLRTILDTSLEVKDGNLDLFKALSGVVVFGSAVNARYHDLTRKWFFGLFRTKERHLIYEKGRRPNDLDVLLIFNAEELDKQDISVSPEENEGKYFSFAADIHSEYYYDSGYGSYTREEVRKGELDILFVSDRELEERLEQGCAIAHHIRDVGVLALGTCPIELRSPNFFSATKNRLSLEFTRA